MPAQQLATIKHRLALRMLETFGLDISALALDMTNFVTTAAEPVPRTSRAAKTTA